MKSTRKRGKFRKIKKERKSRKWKREKKRGGTRKRRGRIAFTPKQWVAKEAVVRAEEGAHITGTKTGFDVQDSLRAKAFYEGEAQKREEQRLRLAKAAASESLHEDLHKEVSGTPPKKKAGGSKKRKSRRRKTDCKRNCRRKTDCKRNCRTRKRSKIGAALELTPPPRGLAERLGFGHKAAAEARQAEVLGNLATDLVASKRQYQLQQQQQAEAEEAAAANARRKKELAAGRQAFEEAAKAEAAAAEAETAQAKAEADIANEAAQRVQQAVRIKVGERQVRREAAEGKTEQDLHSNIQEDELPFDQYRRIGLAREKEGLTGNASNYLRSHSTYLNESLK